jgi:hypothetical protein
MSSTLKKTLKQWAIYFLCLPVLIFLFGDLFFGLTPWYLFKLFYSNGLEAFFLVFMLFILPAAVFFYTWPKFRKIRNRAPSAWAARVIVWLLLWAPIFYFGMTFYFQPFVFLVQYIPAWPLSFLCLSYLMDDTSAEETICK